MKKSKKILKSNRLIAEFMGWTNIITVDEIKTQPDWRLPRYNETNPKELARPVPIELLEYDTSWDWLMSVVEKIEGLVIPNLPDKDDEGISIDFIIGYNYTEIRDEDRLGILELTSYGEDGNKKLAVYSGVVEFIKWYNKQ